MVYKAITVFTAIGYMTGLKDLVANAGKGTANPVSKTVCDLMKSNHTFLGIGESDNSKAYIELQVDGFSPIRKYAPSGSIKDQLTFLEGFVGKDYSIRDRLANMIAQLK